MQCTFLLWISSFVEKDSSGWCYHPARNDVGPWIFISTPWLPAAGPRSAILPDVTRWTKSLKWPKAKEDLGSKTPKSSSMMDALYIIRFLFPCPSEWVQPGTYSSGHVLKLAGSGKVSPVCVRAAACWGHGVVPCLVAGMFMGFQRHIFTQSYHTNLCWGTEYLRPVARRHCILQMQSSLSASRLALMKKCLPWPSRTVCLEKP